MTLPAPTYDLVLLLDPQAEEGARAKIVADARAAIEAQGELLRHDEWGERPLTYPIDKKTSAEYHLLQFHAGTVELLERPGPHAADHRRRACASASSSSGRACPTRPTCARPRRPRAPRRDRGATPETASDGVVEVDVEVASRRAGLAPTAPDALG